ncbi:hypothetical protein CCM_08814 [Cordyceps militaris CM01]|uniref:Uncharacterized protein n=1 Tax=Cordyceps militaris (strain CM01) TaxID=983644 RepID=G3JSH6_CORMM|nr:uncharacterized protein CCM_08814 [Cordyceps militaris CM01]EGX88768.1 hypothetical protein CCM_08814 [Cordyceps militaris CM01]
MAYTIQQCVYGQFVDITEASRPDSPRPYPRKATPPRPPRPRKAPSRNSSRYPPRTAETRNWRPPGQQKQRRPRRSARPPATPSSVDTTTTRRAPKKVSFCSEPESSSSTESVCAASTGPARERRRRERMRATSSCWGGALLRACTGGSSTSGFYKQPHAAAPKACLGDVRVERPAPRRVETTPPRRLRRGGRDHVSNEPPFPVPPRKYTLLDTATAALARHRPRLDPHQQHVQPMPSKRPPAWKLFFRHARTEMEQQQRRYWI